MVVNDDVNADDDDVDGNRESLYQVPPPAKSVEDLPRKYIKTVCIYCSRLHRHINMCLFFNINLVIYMDIQIKGHFTFTFHIYTETELEY